MFKQLIITASLLTTLTLTSQVSASLVLDQYASEDATPETIGGYAMTDFDFLDAAGMSTDTLVSPLGGDLGFLDRYGNSTVLEHDTADNAVWWNNGEAFDYDIYTTNLHRVTITLPEDTVAFSFNVGADLPSSNWNNAWLTATAQDGGGLNTYWFNVTEANTPGFGLYADAGSCSTITSVTIDPLLWGFGNFSINQNGCSTSVPEPSILALMGFGILGLGLARRKMKR